MSRIRTGIRWLLLGFGCLAGGWIELVVLHDVLVYRRETDASTACFKAMFSCALNHAQSLNRVELVQSSDQRFRPAAQELAPGLYSVQLWYDSSAGSRAGTRFPVRCTMRCEGLDDWELVDMKVADEPLVICHEPYSPTGAMNELWLYSWFVR